MVWIVDPHNGTVSIKIVGILSYTAGAVILSEGVSAGDGRGSLPRAAAAPRTEGRNRAKGYAVNHRALGLGLFFLFAMLAGAGGCSKREEAAPVVRPVLTTAVAVETTETFGPFAGAIDARYQTQLGFQISGRIVSRDVQIGDPVKKGIRVAALDTAVLQFQLTSARADVANAEAQLANVSATEERQHALLQTNAAT